MAKMRGHYTIIAKRVENGIEMNCLFVQHHDNVLQICGNKHFKNTEEMLKTAIQILGMNNYKVNVWQESGAFLVNIVVIMNGFPNRFYIHLPDAG